MRSEAALMRDGNRFLWVARLRNTRGLTMGTHHFIAANREEAEAIAAKHFNCAYNTPYKIVVELA